MQSTSFKNHWAAPTNRRMSKPVIQNWGLTDYQSALDRQLECVEVLSLDPEHPGFLIFCSHPPVVTVGRQTQPEDIFSWAGPIIEISRGGRATYHGPSQLVVYPILNLKADRNGRKPQEVRGYLRAFEQAIVETLKTYQISAVGKTPQKLAGKDSESDETGVWVGAKKIASLGIAVKKWITYHGAAINLEHDAEAFKGLNPCGFKSETMISVEKILGKKLNRQEFADNLTLNLIRLL